MWRKRRARTNRLSWKPELATPSPVSKGQPTSLSLGYRVAIWSREVLVVEGLSTVAKEAVKGDGQSELRRRVGHGGLATNQQQQRGKMCRS